MATNDRVREWWNQLTIQERRAIAGRLPGEPALEAGCDWSLPWDDLLRFSQRVRLQVYHDRVIGTGMNDSP
jgi:hypothetical protein